MYKLSFTDYDNPGYLFIGYLFCYSQYAERYIKTAEMVAAG